MIAIAKSQKPAPFKRLYLLEVLPFRPKSGRKHVLQGDFAEKVRN